MFSLNSINTQNQILVSFSQLSARYSSVFKHRKHSYGKNKNVKRKDAAALTYDATICKESLEEALKNLDKDVVVEMKRVDIRSLVSSPRIPRDTERCLSPRKISYVSTDSFEKNKNGWEVQPSRRGFVSFTDKFVGLLSSSIQQRSFDIQVRGFKTDRAIDADLKRNPNLLNRLRKFFGQYK